jgi:hypothetical protein
MGVNSCGKVVKGRLRMLESGERVRVHVHVHAWIYIATAQKLGPFSPAILQHPCLHLQVCWLTKEDLYVTAKVAAAVCMCRFVR